MDQGASPQTVAIDNLVVSEAFQIRRRLDPATIARYVSVIKSGREMPPITVAVLDGALILVSGFHRVEAMRQLGQAEALAVILPVSSEAEARWLAAAANLENGLPLKSTELRGVFQSYIRARRHWEGAAGRSRLKSYREIAQELGGLRAYTTIRSWMRRDFPGVFRRMSGGEDNHHLNGGDRPRTGWTPSDAACEALQQAVAIARGVTDPVERGVIIEAAEQAVEAMKKAGRWEAPDF